MEPLVQYVSDNAASLAKIQAVMEKGALGVTFRVSPTAGMPSDSQQGHNMDGCFTAICYTDKEKNMPRLCRTWCRDVFPLEQPSNAHEETLFQKGGGIYGLRQANIFAYLALAIELVWANPSLQVAEHEMWYLTDCYSRAASARISIVYGDETALVMALEQERLADEIS
jgi:hypothetical protein